VLLEVVVVPEVLAALEEVDAAVVTLVVVEPPLPIVAPV
jgi:hypothetical protein